MGIPGRSLLPKTTTKSPFFSETKKNLSNRNVVMKSALILLASMATLALAEPEARPSGLKVEYISVPETCEQKAMNGAMLSMHYTGTLEDGTKFDSSVDRNEPFKFQIGVGQVIKGWEEGVLGMCVGEKRRLIVPPELGYGDQGAGEIIPGGATLFFDIELLETEDGPAPVNVFKQIDIDADSALSREELSVYLKQQGQRQRERNDIMLGQYRWDTLYLIIFIVLVVGCLCLFQKFYPCTEIFKS